MNVGEIRTFDDNFTRWSQNDVFFNSHLHTQSDGNISISTSATDGTSSTVYRQISYELHQIQSPQPLAVTEGHKLYHSLRAVHIAAISLCVIFGTGLLIGTSRSLHTAGPASLLIAFIVMGFVTNEVMNSLCEMATYIPIPNAYSGYASRYLHPSIGFSLGYCYLISNLIITPNQLTAGAVVIQNWIDRDTINPAVWITIFFLIVSFVSTVRIGNFAIYSTIIILFKFLVLLGFLCFLFVLMLGGQPNNDRIGFRYWKNPGAFAPYSESIDGSLGNFTSFLSVLVNACYSYLGAETFVVTIGEVVYPRVSIPKAKKLIAYPLFFFYFSIILLIGLCIPYNDPKLVNEKPYSSPIVVAIKNASIPILPHIFNGCILVFVISAANASCYMGARILYGLSVSGDTFELFSKTNKHGIPIYSLITISCFNLLAYTNIGKESTQIFSYFVDASASFGLILWDCILLTHIFFIKACKVQAFDRESEFCYHAPGSPYTTWVAFIICIIVTFITKFTVFIDTANGFDYTSFITGYIGIPVFLLICLVHKLKFSTSFVEPIEADLYYYKDYVDAEEEAYLKEMQKKREIQESKPSSRFEMFKRRLSRLLNE
ncbi:uncharacterized protein ASCRUDRAFT_37199 [Ascoidea rubescens DSM 1968]|uniref:Amino acid permease/ SLC12A domain-containing protein n=1 Tax=Ascoidea rubescens DSM 1968 TaxID=1344418 RepID=A0A1D2VD30_9ASCO|nr:hypothetical protein ASCRUDRAFT_37199 [Ascoidea rubescens DSM 1968]ODV59608.1 hypothetical protein ASCRUDRAFT_37199 [Ascoidea rubescens DSM 1968]